MSESYRIRILTCPLCDWSAAYDPDDDERALRMNQQFVEHLDEHAA